MGPHASRLKEFQKETQYFHAGDRAQDVIETAPNFWCFPRGRRDGAELWCFPQGRPAAPQTSSDRRTGLQYMVTLAVAVGFFSPRN